MAHIKRNIGLVIERRVIERQGRGRPLLGTHAVVRYTWRVEGYLIASFICQSNDVAPQCSRFYARTSHTAQAPDIGRRDVSLMDLWMINSVKSVLPPPPTHPPTHPLTARPPAARPPARLSKYAHAQTETDTSCQRQFQSINTLTYFKASYEA